MSPRNVSRSTRQRSISANASAICPQIWAGRGRSRSTARSDAPSQAPMRQSSRCLASSVSQPCWPAARPMAGTCWLGRTICWRPIMAGWLCSRSACSPPWSPLQRPTDTTSRRGCRQPRPCVRSNATVLARSASGLCALLFADALGTLAPRMHIHTPFRPMPPCPYPRHRNHGRCHHRSGPRRIGHSRYSRITRRFNKIPYKRGEAGALSTDVGRKNGQRAAMRKPDGARAGGPTGN
jgi:hypothetical protein